MPLRLRLSGQGGLAYVVAIAASLLVAATLVHNGLKMAAPLVALPLAAALLMPRPRWALFAGIALLLAIPNWYTLGTAQLALFRVAAVLVLVPVIMGAPKLRWRATDLILLVFVGDAIAGAFLQVAEPGVGRVVLNQFITVAFYVAGRALPVRLQPRVAAMAVAAITVGAVSVIVERFVGHVLFSNSQSYSWVSANGGIFRPGGFYGSPPSAALDCAIGLLLGLALLGRANSWQRVALAVSSTVMLTALVLTFERSGWIGFVVGVIVYWLLSRRDARRLLKYSIAVGLAVVVGVFAYPYFSSSSAVQNGVLRHGAGNTLAAREAIWKEVFPVVTSNPQHALFGLGFGSTYLILSGHVPRALESSPLLVDNGIHNQYLSILLEQGAVGLGLFLLLLASAAWPGIKFAIRRDDRLAAALVASVAAMMVAGLAGVAFYDQTNWPLSLLVLGLLVSRARSTPTELLPRTRAVPPGNPYAIPRRVESDRAAAPAKAQVTERKIGK